MKSEKITAVLIPALFVATAVLGVLSVLCDSKTSVAVWAENLSITLVVKIIFCSVFLGLIIIGAGVLLFCLNKQRIGKSVTNVGINISTLFLCAFAILFTAISFMQVITRLAASRFSTHITVALGKGLLALVGITLLVLLLIIRDNLLKMSKAVEVYFENGTRAKIPSVFVAVCLFAYVLFILMNFETTAVVTLAFETVEAVSLTVMGVLLILLRNKMKPETDKKRDLYFMDK